MIDLAQLRKEVENALNSYEYGQSPGAIGKPLSDEWIAEHLVKMRRCIITPYWETVKMDDLIEKTTTSRSCAIVADHSDGYCVAFDPVTQEFLLAYRGTGGTLVSWGIRGGAVDCFLAR